MLGGEPESQPGLAVVATAGSWDAVLAARVALELVEAAVAVPFRQFVERPAASTLRAD